MLGRRGFAGQGSQKNAFAAITTIEKDYYRILEVTPTSTPEQIKEAYRRLVKKYHPDARAKTETD